MLDLMDAPPTAPAESKPKRPRRAYDLDDKLHAAIERRAAKLTLEYRRSVSISEALAIILEVAVAPELSELAIAEGQPRRRRK